MSPLSQQVRVADRNRKAPGSALIVAPTIANLASGVTEDVRRVSTALAAMSWDIALMTVAREPSTNLAGCHTRSFANAFGDVPILSRFCFSPALSRALSAAVGGVDVVHAHGLWIYPNACAANAARRVGKPYVISTRGMLAPEALEYSAIRKRIFWWAHQRRALEGAASLHVVSDREYEGLRAMGVTSPIAVIPHGIERPRVAPRPSLKGTKRTILSLGRLHPIKGLDTLILAWARLEKDNPDWCLKIAGPSEANYQAKLRRIATDVGATRVEFLGPRAGQEKDLTFASASLFVLPSRSENFALTVLEALSHGVPVIATKGTPWARLPENHCGWWIDHGVESLAATLAHAMRLPPGALEGMGARGRDWVSHEFTWEKTARSFDHLYRWVAGRSEPPPELRFE
jgi:glycosyltransferase involved in cell wall biosynthesis